MEAIAKAFNSLESARPAVTPIKTNLYELIEAIDEEMEPGEEWLVAKTVLHLIDTGNAKFLGTDLIGKQ